MATRSNEPPSSEDLMREIATLRTDLGKITETLAAMGRAEAQSMTDELRSKTRRTRKHVEDELDHLRDTAENALDRADDMIRERPGLSMAIAAGLGLVVGLLLYRKD
jgi:ElaB/YqjD/DUF883 family membrane-anchored ribosome-binding protein